MKWWLLYSLFPLFLWQPCTDKKTSVVGDSKTNQPVKDSIHFASQVQPILVKNCSPCHFPGGKMYERMPFDQDTTIINHEKGILKRIKKEEENAIIKTFILQNFSATKQSH